MSKLQYQCAMSLDGCIAGLRGDMSWLSTASVSDEATSHDDEPDDTNPLVELVGAVLSGRRTYDGDDPNAGTDKEGGYDGHYTGPTFVLTHRPPATPVPGVTFVGELDTAIALAREAAGDKLVSVLGADVARQCLEVGALDEVLVYLIPVLLGDGVRFFDRPGSEPVRLDVLESRSLYVRAAILY